MEVVGIPSICLKLAATMRPSSVDQRDKRRWLHDEQGIFTVKSAYQFVSGSLNGDSAAIWHSLWNLDVPECIKSFAWLAFKEKLLTNQARHSQGMSLSPICPRCGLFDETVDHIFRQCSKTKMLWYRMVAPR